MAKPGQTITEFIGQSNVFKEAIPFIYESLDSTRSQIRLMHILPGDFHDEQTNVTLSIVDLELNPKYDTLSYTWGSLSLTKTINLCGVPYKVTENQYSALRRLRLSDEQRTIWMDVTCINQADIAERGHQVSIMGQIYANAVQTRIWLGEPESSWSALTDDEWNGRLTKMNSNPELLTWMKENANHRSAEIVDTFMHVVEEESDGILKGAVHILKLLKDKVHMRHMPFCYFGQDGELIHYRPYYRVLKTLMAILNSPWWTRVWVMQEACLSKTTPIVHVGSQSFSIRVFIDAWVQWKQNFEVAQNHIDALVQIYDLRGFIAAFGRLNAYANAVETIGHRFGNLRLYIGLSLVNSRQASDKRDFVYGTMGIVKESDRVPIDYSLNLSEVFSLASWEVFVERTDGFDMLKQAIGINSDNLPTWAIDWSQRDEAFFPDFDLFQAEEEIDYDLTQCFIEQGVIQVTGNQLDTIVNVLEAPTGPFPTLVQETLKIISSWVRQLHAMGVLSDTQLQIDDEDHEDEKSVEIADFLTTILREVKENDQGRVTRFDLFSPSSCNTHRKDIVDWLDILRRAYNSDDEDLVLEALSHTLTNDFQHSIRSSALCTTERGQLCMAPHSVEAGDHLYHIRGCCVPFAVRPAEPQSLSVAEDGSDDDDDRSLAERQINPSKVVGPCYMKGAMGTDRADHANQEIIFLV